MNTKFSYSLTPLLKPSTEIVRDQVKRLTDQAGFKC